MDVTQSPDEISLTGPGGSMLSGGNLGTGTGAPGSPGAGAGHESGAGRPSALPSRWRRPQAMSRELMTEPGGVSPGVPPRDPDYRQVQAGHLEDPGSLGPLAADAEFEGVIMMRRRESAAAKAAWRCWCR